ncbi:hypothetical protein [Streptomyces naphthomycinicus]|uniref:hypothetical protein n=1 Tax=Streptomyces naphthomycinicus TaxID=2872625 RepID=UPI001CEC447F|nr:hypothetical protein [Streptomyces sp. TML10]
MTHRIEPGQVYRSCKPIDNGFRIRITHVNDYSVRAVDAANGRPLLRRVLSSSLHDSPTTRDGQPRRTGYALEQQ